MLKKYPNADLKGIYPIAMEAGVILTLIATIVLVKMPLSGSSDGSVLYVEPDESALILPPVVIEETYQVIPPKPEVPIVLPNDEAIEPPPIEIMELKKTARLMIPPLPEEIKVQVNYDLLKGIEELPELIGGEEAFHRTIEYPEKARRLGVEGIVEVEFMVDESGKVLDPVIVRSLGAGCDEAVLNAIKLQRYKPGKKGGKITPFKIREFVQFILLDA